MGRKYKWKLAYVSVGLLLLLSMLLPKNDYVFAEEEGVNNPKFEMRAAWISTVANIDLQAGMNEADYTAWVESTVKMLKEKNFNTIVFQVKPTSDALYPSELAPWSQYITGEKQGTDPGYDPLQIMLDTAHDYGLELHAWINPYRVTMASDKFEDLDEANFAVKNEEWVVKHGSQYYLDPGIPEVSEYLVDTVEEIVENYDVDAVHMDDYFYPGVEFEDEETFEEYGNDFAEIEDWRRNNVNELVADINQRVKEIKPWVQFGISPSGIWRNDTTDPSGSATAGSEHYDNLFADSRQWIKDGSIDYITPQIYWSRELSIARYDILADWWAEQVRTYAETHPVNLYIGMADYKVGGGYEEALDQPREIVEQVFDNRENDAIRGQMHFTLRDIKNNPINYQDIISDEAYHYKSLTPSHVWNGGTVPDSPSTVQIIEEDNEVSLSIFSEDRDVRKFVVYRSDDKEIDYSDPTNIVDVLFNERDGVTFHESIDEKLEQVTYGIKSISRTGVESESAFEVNLSLVEVDTEALIELIEQVNQLDASHYTTKSWEALEKTVDEANVVIQDDHARQEEVNQMVQRLEQAIEDLEIDKSALSDLVKQVDELDGEKYTNESWEHVQVVLKEAKAILQEANASVDDVKGAVTSLQIAVEALEEKELVDKADLKEQVTLAKSKNEEDYEKASWNIFKEALQDAQTVLDNNQATQADVDEALKQLKQAMDQLQKVKKAEPEEVVVEKEDDVAINKEIQSDDGGKELPKTASPFYNMLVIGSILIFAGSSLAFMQRRKLAKVNK